jgi:hypothetical protein
MKIIAYILSFYILVLTAIPCIDIPQDNLLQKIEQGQNTNGNHQNNTDNCSPFWPCSTCITPVISQAYTLQFNYFSYSQKHFAEYKSDHISNLSSAIWQPPKIG